MELVQVFLALRLAAACVLGLFLPGYFLARICRARAAGWLAFPLSLVILFHCVFAVGLMEWRITFWHVAVFLAVVNLLLGVGYWKSRSRESGSSGQLDSTKLTAKRTGVEGMWGAGNQNSGVSERFSPLAKFALICAAISLLVLVQQSLLTPLSGYDTIFRWDYLARRILEIGRFDFYPPVRAADFKDYYWPDGFPPIVAFAYWWIYAAYGKYVPQLSSLSVVPQYLVVLGLTFWLAARMGGKKAGALAVGLLATSSAYFRDQAIGQESGVMAVSLLAMLWVLLCENRSSRMMIAAGVCAAVGAMCREYGWAYVIFGLVLIVCRYRSGKEAGWFFGSALIVAGPWYLRNWILTGNPFWSLKLPGMPVNPVFWEMMQTFPPHYGAMAWSGRVWRETIVYLLVGSPLQLIAGTISMTLLLRKERWLAAAVVMSFALWLYSASYTNGGAQYSTRTLAPAWGIMSACAGIWMVLWRGPARRGMGILVAICFVIAFASDWIFPFSFFNPPPGSWVQVGLEAHPRYDPVEAIVPQVQSMLRPGSRILGDNLVAFARLQNLGYELVPPWSPEVAFLFDPNVSAAQAIERLRARNIRAVLAAPEGSGTFFFVEHSRFYQGAAQWQKIGAAPGVILFRLPDLSDQSLKPDQDQHHS